MDIELCVRELDLMGWAGIYYAHLWKEGTFHFAMEPRNGLGKETNKLNVKLSIRKDI